MVVKSKMMEQYNSAARLIAWIICEFRRLTGILNILTRLHKNLHYYALGSLRTALGLT